jgi:uncharacterized membrane protein YdcZ (DUF606 family)
MKVLAFCFAFLAGALISVQAGSNTQLKKALGDPIPAAVADSCLSGCFSKPQAVV